MPQPWRRQNVPYPSNGVFNPSWEWLDKPEAAATLAQQHKTDIGDKKIKEHVHGFASEDRNVLPMPYPKQEVAYPANGFKNPDY